MAAAGARIEEAGAFFEDARRRFEAAGRAHAAARVSARSAESMWDLGRLRDGLTIIDEAFDLLSKAARCGSRGSGSPDRRFAFFFGDSEVGARRIHAALEVAEDLDLPEVYSQALDTKALILSSQGRRRESRALLREALAVAVEHDRPSAALRAHNNLGDFMCQDDRYAEAQRHIDEQFVLARRSVTATGSRSSSASSIRTSCSARGATRSRRWTSSAGGRAHPVADRVHQGFVAFGSGSTFTEVMPPAPIGS